MVISIIQEINNQDQTARLRIAKKVYPCRICPTAIEQGSDYYAIIRWNCGIEGITYPDRVHVHCLQKYWEKENLRKCHQESMIILLPEHRAAGLSLLVDDHIVRMMQGDKQMAVFQSLEATITNIREEADRIIEQAKADEIVSV